MRGLFSFPNPVNETPARLVAGAVAVIAVLAIAFQQGWLIPVLAYGFVARALTGPTLSPLALVATRVVTPHLPFRPRYSPGPAKRFAQTIGAAFTLTATAVSFAGFQVEAYALVGVVQFVRTLHNADPTSTFGGSSIAASIVPPCLGLLVCIVCFRNDFGKSHWRKTSGHFLFVHAHRLH